MGVWLLFFVVLHRCGFAATAPSGTSRDHARIVTHGLERAGDLVTVAVVEEVTLAGRNRPTALQVLGAHGIQELRCAFTQGRWLWTRAPVRSAPTGIECWMMFNRTDNTDVTEAWLATLRALSTLLSVSTVGLANAAVVSTTGRAAPGCPASAVGTVTVYAAAPLAFVCSNTLARWRRLHPCRFNDHFEALEPFSGDFLSLALDVTQSSVTLTQTVVQRLQRNKTNILAATLGNRRLTEPACLLRWLRTDAEWVLDAPFVRSQDLREVVVAATQATACNVSVDDKLFGMTRHVHGQGRGWRTLHVRLSVFRAQGALNITCQQVFPSEILVWRHTLRVCEFFSNASAETLLVPTAVDFQPAGGPGHAALLRVTLLLARIPGSVVISVDFRVQHRALAAYPPDPHRGVDVPPAAAWGTEQRAAVYSEPLVVAAPLPDFSLPFNVITLSSTLLAVIFGMLLKRPPRSTNS